MLAKGGVRTHMVRFSVRHTHCCTKVKTVFFCLLETCITFGNLWSIISPRIEINPLDGWRHFSCVTLAFFYYLYESICNMCWMTLLNR